MMQFREGDIKRIIHACEYYRSIIRSQDADLAKKYDRVLDHLHDYQTEMECPDCWDPESICEIHV